jgi:hypothetical protein
MKTREMENCTFKPATSLTLKYLMSTSEKGKQKRLKQMHERARELESPSRINL